MQNYGQFEANLDYITDGIHTTDRRGSGDRVVCIFQLADWANSAVGLLRRGDPAGSGWDCVRTWDEKTLTGGGVM